MGAGKWGGGSAARYQSQSYSQEEQANFIKKTLEILNRIRIDGIFLYTLIEKWDPTDVRSFGILKFNRESPSTRKLGFYLYKTYSLM